MKINKNIEIRKNTLQVWSDQKKYVRHKAAQNLKASKATGGGPNAELKFSATEEAVYDLIAMQESVGGVAKTFGLGTSSGSPATTKDISLAEDTENIEYQPPPKKQKAISRELPPPKSSASADIIAEELGIQKEMCQAMKEQQQNTKKIYRGIDRLYDLKKEELAEAKRHNLQMEKLRLREVEDKIEKNRRLIELEELKSKIF